MRPILAAILALTLSSASPWAQRFTPRVAPSPEQTDDERWSVVQTVAEGTRLEVQCRGGQTVSGSLRSADRDRLVVVVDEGSVEILRSSILRVVRIGNRTVGKSAGLGFLIGAAIGATQGALTVRTDRAKWILWLAAGEGAIGALIGVIHGSNARKRTVLYETR
jgi:hypothetical protein